MNGDPGRSYSIAERIGFRSGRMRETQINELKWITMLIALVASGLILGVMLRLQMVSGANDGSRWNTVWSLTNGKGYIIDEAPYSTIDKVRRDGHFYSSKPPLMPTVLAGLAWLIRATTGWAIPHQAHIVTRVILVLVNIVPFCVLGGSLWKVAGKDADRAGGASVLHLGCCLWHVFDLV